MCQGLHNSQGAYARLNIMSHQTGDLRIAWTKVLLPPLFLEEELPMTDGASDAVNSARNQICDILRGKDDRVVVITGPCSIHDVEAAREYARLLKGAIPELSDRLCI